MKTLLASLLLTTAALHATPNNLTTLKGINLEQSTDSNLVYVWKDGFGWGGNLYRVIVRDENGRKIDNFVSDVPFQKTKNGWLFKIEGRNKYKEVSGNVSIGRL